MACTMAVSPSPRAASKVALQPGEVLFDTQLRGQPRTRTSSGRIRPHKFDGFLAGRHHPVLSRIFGL